MTKKTTNPDAKTKKPNAKKSPAKKPSRKPTKKTQPVDTSKLAPKTFGQSLNQAPQFFAVFDGGKLTEKEAAVLIDKFLINSDTVRGFCITLLTGEFLASDAFPAVLVERMRAGPAAVFEVMAKNVVMAPTMAVTHRANKDSQMAASSDKVTARTIKLIRLMNSASMVEQLKEMRKAFLGEESAYKPFVTTWKYRDNPEQVSAAVKAIDDCLAP